MLRIESSISSASIDPSSELLPEESEPIMLMLPKDPDMFVLSVFAMVDHSEVGVKPGDSARRGNWLPLLLPGIFIARPPIVGEESGDSASVE